MINIIIIMTNLNIKMTNGSLYILKMQYSINNHIKQFDDILTK